MDEPAAEEVEDDPLELPLPVLGAVVVVLVLPIWVFVISRTCLAALSQHLPWLTLAEGVVVVVVLWAAATPIPVSIAAAAISATLVIVYPSARFAGQWSRPASSDKATASMTVRSLSTAVRDDRLRRILLIRVSAGGVGYLNVNRPYSAGGRNRSKCPNADQRRWTERGLIDIVSVPPPEQ